MGKLKKYIQKELTPEAEAAANQVLDAKGLVVAPGLVDVHVHFRDPGLTYKEDIHTGAAAAAKEVLPPLCVWQIQSPLWIMKKHLSMC